MEYKYYSIKFMYAFYMHQSHLKLISALCRRGDRSRRALSGPAHSAAECCAERICVCPVMHVKCIHELWTIILVFHSYLHHIRVISLFYIDFGDNSQFPHLFGINPALVENLLSIFWCFRDPNDVQMSYKFMRIVILEGGRPRSERSKQMEAGGPK